MHPHFDLPMNLWFLSTIKSYAYDKCLVPILDCTLSKPFIAKILLQAVGVVYGFKWYLNALSLPYARSTRTAKKLRSTTTVPNGTHMY